MIEPRVKAGIIYNWQYDTTADELGAWI